MDYRPKGICDHRRRVCGLLPFEFRREPHLSPLRVGESVLPADENREVADLIPRGARKHDIALRKLVPPPFGTVLVAGVFYELPVHPIGDLVLVDPEARQVTFGTGKRPEYRFRLIRFLLDLSGTGAVGGLGFPVPELSWRHPHQLGTIYRVASHFAITNTGASRMPTPPSYRRSGSLTGRPDSVTPQGPRPGQALRSHKDGGPRVRGRSSNAAYLGGCQRLRGLYLSPYISFPVRL